MTTDTSSFTAAAEHPFGTDFSGLSEVDSSFNVMVRKIDITQEGLHMWTWLAEIGPSDWLQIIVLCQDGEYDDAFGEQVLIPMVQSIQVDGTPIYGAVEPQNTTHLTALPLDIGTPVLDRFNDNSNDWRFASIVDGQLIVDAQGLDTLRWAFSNPLLNGDPAFYAQAKGTLVSDTNYYQYGLAFRVEDGNNFYYFVIDHLQRYGLFAMNSGTLNNLIAPTFDGTIAVGQGTSNTLGALVIGDYIEVYLNGKRVGAVVDETHKVGGARVATYTYVDSNSPVVVGFDDFAYVPLVITGDQTLLDQRTAVIATVQNASSVLAAPQQGASKIVALPAQTLIVALARSQDNRYVFGYGAGATGWVPASAVQLARAGQPVTVGSLPILDSTTQGIRVQTWPITWPAEDNTEPTPAVVATPPAGMTMIAYGQTLTVDIAAGELQDLMFNGVAGQSVTLRVETVDSPALDTSAQISAPNGSVTASDDDSGPGLNPLIDGVTLPSSGLYTITIQSVTGGGQIRVTLSRAG